MKQTLKEEMQQLMTSVDERSAAAALLQTQLDSAATSAAADTITKDELQQKVLWTCVCVCVHLFKYIFILLLPVLLLILQ